MSWLLESRIISNQQQNSDAEKNKQKKLKPPRIKSEAVEDGRDKRIFERLWQTN